MFSTRLCCLCIFLFLNNNVNSDSLQTQILEARQLFPYRSYKDVQLFQYTIPSQVTFASFQYKANGSFNCPSKTVAVYLQYGSYPVMSLQNSTYPQSFVIHRLFLHHITLTSDFIPVVINVTNPLPGNWYAAAFLVENTERIAQKGLFTPCLSWLSSSLKFNLDTDVINILQNSQSVQTVFSVQTYRFFASKESWISKILLSNFSLEPSILITARQLAFPSHNESDSVFLSCNTSENCALSIIPAADNWNYFEITNLESVPISFNLIIETDDCKYSSQNGDFVTKELVFQDISNETMGESLKATCWPNVPLIRISLPTNLAFEYNLPPEEDDAYPFILNISNSEYTLTSFEVLPTVDIGGTLAVELAVSPFMNISQNIIAVSGCLSYGTRPSLIDVDCLNGHSLVVNTSHQENRFSTLFVPFPEAGLWYLRLKSFCYESDTDNRSFYTLCDFSKTPVFLRIRSTPCVLGHCGKFGTCYQYVSGGLIFSTCNCIAGWKGWGCTDGSTARTDKELIMDVLFLTLSNLIFIPAIITSVYRRYFTEAFVYFATMVSSAFYHACDSEVYSYCLIRLSVLQFCDFYMAILSIWVTLVALAKLPHSLQSFIHMVGAIGVALGVEYDRTGLWVFVVPTGIGLLILITSWVIRCYKKHLCYPTRKIWLSGLLPGILLALTGLIIYAFFETQNNYPYVHSMWHITIALSVLFLLPKGKNTGKNTPEPTSSCSYIRVGDATIQDGSAPTGTAYTHLLTPTP